MNECQRISADAACLATDEQELDELTRYLMGKYGPLLGKGDLAKVLRFPTVASLERCQQRGNLHIELVKLPSRRGSFARARDVARYLSQIPCDGSDEPPPEASTT